MAELKGTVIASAITPGSTDDIFATHREAFGEGGYRTVATVAEMLAIPLDRRKVGMLVNVTADNKIRKLVNNPGTASTQNSDWEEFSTAGATGAQGRQGPQGPTGPQGHTGPQGSTGAQGPRGYQGLTGTQGPTGPQGPQGPTGSPGSNGSRGYQGPQGPMGTGITIKGSLASTSNLPTSGTIGDAYLIDGNIYVYVGSGGNVPGNTRYTNGGNIQGPTGPQGATGAQGRQGPQGPKGTPYWSSGEGSVTSASSSIHADHNIYAPAFYENSDARLKTIVGNLEKLSLHQILQIPLVKFYFNADKSKTTRLGTIAQNIKEICPEIVRESEETGYLGVEYDKLAILALHAVKELSNEIDILHQEIRELRDLQRKY